MVDLAAPLLRVVEELLLTNKHNRRFNASLDRTTQQCRSETGRANKETVQIPGHDRS